MVLSSSNERVQIVNNIKAYNWCIWWEKFKQSGIRSGCIEHSFWHYPYFNSLRKFYVSVQVSFLDEILFINFSSCSVAAVFISDNCNLVFFMAPNKHVNSIFCPAHHLATIWLTIDANSIKSQFTFCIYISRLVSVWVFVPKTQALLV